MPTHSWRDGPLVALDLEGTGAQDREDEAILEIALVPIIDGRPVVDHAYSTLVSPGRPVPRRPWISPGLTDSVLAAAPTLSDIEPELARRTNGQIIVGHNVITIDWRLLQRRCPALRPAGLIDTLRLARHLQPSQKKQSLTDNLERHGLTGHVTALAPASQPHRALWDSIAAALLLAALLSMTPGARELRLDELLAIAGLPLPGHTSLPAGEQTSLLDI